MKGRYYMWMAATATAYLLGVGTGILFSKNRMEQKYKRIANEEIESVKKAFAKKAEKKETPPAPESENQRYSGKEDPSDKNTAALYRILRQTGYAGEDGIKPYILSPDEFGERDDFDQISLTYFSDGVLTDENYYPLEDEDATDMIGADALDHFGEYEEDSVFVRNEAMKTDFEILLDQRRYSDVQQTMPPQ